LIKKIAQPGNPADSLHSRLILTPSCVAVGIGTAYRQTYQTNWIYTLFVLIGIEAISKLRVTAIYVIIDIPHGGIVFDQYVLNL